MVRQLNVLEYTTILGSLLSGIRHYIVLIFGLGSL